MPCNLLFPYATPSLSAQDSVVFESGKAGFVKFLAPW